MLSRPRQVVLFVIWLFLMWLGLTAMWHPEFGGRDEILGLYVLVASLAVTTLLHWIWRQNSN
jgi:hypothetical protein